MKLKNLSNIILGGGVDLYEDKDNTFFSKSLQNYQSQFYEDIGSKNQTLAASKDYLNKRKGFNFIKTNYNSFETNLNSIQKSLSKHRFTEIISITYLDTVLKKETFFKLIDKLSENKKAIVTLSPINKFDLISSSKEIFEYKGKNYKYGGVCILKKETVKEFSFLISNNHEKTLPYIFFNTDFSQKVKFVPLSENELIEVNEKNNIAKLYFGSKANSLINVERSLKKLEIPKFMVLGKKEINKNTYKKILSYFKNKDLRVMIRSNSSNEDSFETSNAGKYLTLGPASLKDKNLVMKYIDNVLNSYGREKDKTVLIQEFVEDIRQSGVVTSSIPGRPLNYYAISVSEIGDFDKVTSGNTNNITTIFVHRSLRKITPNLTKYKKFLEAIKQIEDITQYNSVDIELINTTKKSYLVQARPLTKTDNNLKNIEKEKYLLLKEMRRFQSLSNQTNGRFGNKNFYSNMSDWNPAEMIGKKPDQLSILLYDFMIANETWNKQRVSFGYRFFSNTSLMTTFGDSAYINVKNSLNSFLPKKISDESCKKIIDFQLNQLIKTPEYHDKIEFKIAETDLKFESLKYLQKKYKNILDKKEIEIWNSELENIFYGSEKIHNINSTIINNSYQHISRKQPINKTYLNYVKNNLALPFAHHARIAFMYISQLNQLVELEVINDLDSNKLKNNIDSISNQMRKDAYDVKINKKSLNSFIRKYGHVRPGNYDIDSKNLGKSIEEIIIPMIENSSKYINEEIDHSIILKIDQYLKKVDFKLDGQKWVSNFRKSIASRENSKFYYSKGLDSVLTEFEKNRVFKDKFLDEYSYNQNIYKGFGNINYGDVLLPDTIVSSEDFFAHKQIKNKPNFQGFGLLKGSVKVINSQKIQSSNLKNKIVLIDSADPGWDWIFSFDIKGLLTKYGGPNSHMAIRCAENNIHCVMGLGDSFYDEIVNFKSLIVNFENETIRGE